MPSIEQLPPSVINKIAAGEVIARPSSVVKELMENAVDSDSSRVDVDIQQGGAERICVSDNGCGIPEDQLPLAVTSHATSKIRNADDLYRVGTLGVRGEALASIAEVSRLTLRSRIATGDAGYEMRVEGGSAEPATPCGCPVGTTVEIRNLFFNTPVRRKFLRSQQTEMGHCGEAFARIALAYPAVHFSMRHNDRLIHDLPPVENWRDRIAALFGNDLSQSLIHVEGDDEEHLKLQGFVANPSQSRSNNRMQYLFLNGRHFRDRSLQHALGEAYRGLLMVGRFPIAFLRIEMAPELVDVNVHPTKIEVRFQDGGRVYSHLLASLRTRFLAIDLTHSLAGTSPRSAGPTSNSLTPSTDQGPASNWKRPYQNESSLGTMLHPPQTDLPRSSPTQERFPFPSQRPASTFRLPFGDSPERAEVATPFDSGVKQSSPDNSEVDDDCSAQAIADDTRSPTAIQIHNCYIVMETGDGVVVIDQHALHERILYEQLREKVLTGHVETQKLLVPEPVDLAPAEAAVLLDSRELLAEMGIDVQPFGGGTVLVSGYPAMLANINPAELLRLVVDHLVSQGKGPEARDLLDDLLHMISCKAAIKAGDRLSGAEITALIDQREYVRDSHHCPHGRPTSLTLTKQELDRKFGRT